MKRICILVEGATEERFVNELLAPIFLANNMLVHATQVITSTDRSAGKVHKGGLVSYSKAKSNIMKLLPNFDCVTTMFDLYALPMDFPMRESEEYRLLRFGRDKAEFLERAFEQDIHHPKFIANLMVHEFEALLFSDIDGFKM